MERFGYNQLMSTARFKPGDIVWTNGSTYGPWPGKVLHVSDQILRIYPDVTQILHYVELYVKKDRDFHPEFELWPFQEGRGKVSASINQQVKLFHQAVAAAQEEGKSESTEFEMPGNSEIDVENVASFCERPFLRNNRSADANENLQTAAEFNPAIFPQFSYSSAANNFDMPILRPCTQSKPVHNVPSYKVDVSPKSQFKKTSPFGKVPNKDLNSPDVYEFTESEPMALNIGRRVLNIENFPKTRLRRGIVPLGLNIVEGNPNLEEISESSQHSTPGPINLSTKRKIPSTETSLRPRNAEHETVVKSISVIPKLEPIGIVPKLEPIIESKVDDKPAPLDISVKAKIPKIEPKASVSRRGRKSKKRRTTKKSTVQKSETNDLPDEPIFNDPPGDETIEEQPESKVLGISSHMQLVPSMASPDLNENNRVGFLGLGGLGRKIITKLVACDHEVILWNKTFYKGDVFDLGVQTTSTPEQVVNSCDVTFCCVSDTAAVKEVYYSPNGAKNAIREGKAFVILTTIDPEISSAIEEDVIIKGGLYLEAPLFPAGGEVTDNCLMTLIGGNRSHISTCLPYFRSFIKDLFYVGKVPEASKMMLLMKTLSGVKIAALAESMALARSCEVPINILFEIIKQTQLASPFLISRAQAMLESEPWSEDGVFPLAHFSNDLTSTLNLTSDLDTPVIAAAKQVYLHSKARGNVDLSAVFLKYTEP